MIRNEIADTFKMDRRKLLFYFAKADEILRDKNQFLSIYVSGGANMCLYVNTRESTHDIDTYPSDEDILWELSETMQRLFELPSGWINPSGTLFVTEKMRSEAIQGLNFNNLNVYFLSFQAMLVLKVLSGRTDDKFFDVKDTVNLLKKLNLKTLAEVDRLIDEYKPDWNNPLVMKFSEECLKKAWTDYQPAVLVDGVSESFRRYVVMKHALAGD